MKSLPALAQQSKALGVAVRQLCSACDACASCSRFLIHEVSSEIERAMARYAADADLSVDMLACPSPQQISQRFFLNLFVVWLSSLARLHALACHMARLSYQLYEALQSSLPSEDLKDPAASALQAVVNSSLNVAIEQPQELPVEEAGAAVAASGGDLDDLGESLGQAAPAPPASAAAAQQRSSMPNSSPMETAQPPVSSKPAAARPVAMLAGDYSSSEDEEEEKRGVVDRRPAPEPEGALLPFFIDRGESGGAEAAAGMVEDASVEVGAAVGQGKREGPSGKPGGARGTGGEKGGSTAAEAAVGGEQRPEAKESRKAKKAKKAKKGVAGEAGRADQSGKQPATGSGPPRPQLKAGEAGGLLEPLVPRDTTKSSLETGVPSAALDRPKAAAKKKAPTEPPPAPAPVEPPPPVAQANKTKKKKKRKLDDIDLIFKSVKPSKKKG